VSGKPVLLREVAQRDIRAAVDHYLREAGPDIAFGLIDALQSTYQAIAAHPALGSPRYALELALPGLRTLATKGFSYLLFYIDRGDHVDVWRVLHARRDIPSRMREPEASVD
jgi:toxin ParE1/3/4